MCCLCYDISKWLDILVFSDNDYKPLAPSPASSLCWLMGDIKEPTHFSQREGNLAPGDIGGLGNQEFKKTQVQLCYHHCLPKIVPKKYFFFIENRALILI